MEGHLLLNGAVKFNEKMIITFHVVSEGDYFGIPVGQGNLIQLFS